MPRPRTPSHTPESSSIPAVRRAEPLDRRRRAGRGLSRRDFLAASAVGTAAATVGLSAGCAAPGARRVGGPLVVPSGAEKEPIRVGVIGCGGRGTGAAMDCVRSAPNVEIVALGDLFEDRLEECQKALFEKVGDRLRISRDRCFTGFESYRGVLSCDLDLVILATPPGFRPRHLAAAIEAGKHVFMEKPVAVDPVGVRSIIASSELAERKGLAIVAGTQRRHQPNYLEAMRRVHDGMIGTIVAAQCYWNQGELWVKHKQPHWSDMEWQCRNWLYFCWLSGDHIVEQHVHNLDVVNWALDATPVRCVGIGGRQVRTGPEFGDIYDHFSVEYEFANGARALSMCRQIKGTSSRVSERIVGTKGTAYTDGGGNAEITVRGKTAWKYEAPASGAVNPYVQEHADLIASIRAGRPLNEGRRIAESTLTAIMGRMSAYTGRELQWDWVLKASKLDLTPPAYEFGDLPVGAVPMPGETKLV